MCLPVTSERDELINSCTSYREENCNLLNPLGHKAHKLDFENLPERDGKEATAHPNVQCEWLPKEGF